MRKYVAPPLKTVREHNYCGAVFLLCMLLKTAEAPRGPPRKFGGHSGGRKVESNLLPGEDKNRGTGGETPVVYGTDRSHGAAAAALMAGAPIGWNSLLRQPGGLGCEGKVVKPWPFGGRWWRPASANPRRGEPAWPGGARIEKAKPGWTLPVRRSESRVPAKNPWV